jgi:hypothetical protein
MNDDTSRVQKSEPTETFRRIRPLVVPESNRRAWLWALRWRNGWCLDDILEQGANEIVRQVIRERAAAGKFIPPEVAQAVAEKKPFKS